MSTGEKFERAVNIMARLRAPGGCPWDREQTFDSIKPYTVEETYEVLEAIDNRDWPELAGELGDLLLQVLFYAEMAREAGYFTIDKVIERLSAKLVSRHPHVFADAKADTAGEVVRNWEATKREEKKQRGEVTRQTSVLDGVSSAMPALLEATKLTSKAADVGFDWPDIGGLFEKLAEETGELRQELKQYPAPGPQPKNRGMAGAREMQVPPELQKRLEDEVGDMLFTLVNIARYLSLDPESALRRTNRKFKRRFQWMEQRLDAAGKQIGAESLDEMDSLWQQAKRFDAEPAK